MLYHILPSRRYLFSANSLASDDCFPSRIPSTACLSGTGDRATSSTAHLPILGDGIERDVVLLRKTILLVNVTLEIPGTVPSEGLVERPGPVGRRIARDFDRFDMHQRIAHEVVHKGVQPVEFARIAVERRGKAGQVDLVTDRIIRVALTLHKEPGGRCNRRRWPPTASRCRPQAPAPRSRPGPSLPAAAHNARNRANVVKIVFTQ